MSNPNINLGNLDARYTKTADVAAAISAQATTDAGQYSSKIAPRVPLGDRIFYVSKAITANDTNSGQSPGEAFATVNAALNFANGAPCTIKLGFGMWIEDVTLSSGQKLIGSNAGYGASPGYNSNSPYYSIIKGAIGSTNPGVLMIAPGPVTDLVVRDIQIHQNNNSSQHGIYLYARPVTTGGTGGAWNGTFENIEIGGTAAVGTHRMWLRGGGVDGLCPHQYLTFRNIYTISSGTDSALVISGQTGQVSFDAACEFDGPGKTSGGKNIHILPECDNSLNAISGQMPYTLLFNGTTSESNTYCWYIEGAYDVSLYSIHVEACQFGPYFTGSSYGMIDSPHFWNVTVGDGSGCCISVINGAKIIVSGRPSFLAPVEQQYYSDSTSFMTVEHGAAALDNAMLTNSTGLTKTISVDSTGYVNLNQGRSFVINTTTTQIKLISSSLPPGQPIFIRSQGGPMVIASAYNAQTVTGGSIGAVLPQSTINLTSTGGFNNTAGTALVFTQTGWQRITYTGVSGGALTGVTGGTGTLTASSTVTNANISANTNGGTGSIIIPANGTAMLVRQDNLPALWAVVSVTNDFASVVAVTGTTTISSDRLILADATSGAYTVTGPNSAVSRQWGVKKTDATTNIVTVSYTDATGAAATINLTQQNDAKWFWPQGSGYVPVWSDFSRSVSDSRYSMRQIRVEGMGPAKATVGTWASIQNSTAYFSGYQQNSGTSALNDSITYYDVLLDAGTWRLDVFGILQADGAQITASLIGTSTLTFGTVWDQYASSTTSSNITLGSVTVTNAALYTLRFTVTGRNASNTTTYRARISAAILTKTA